LKKFRKRISKSEGEVIVEILRVFQKIDRKIKMNGVNVENMIEPSKMNFLLGRADLSDFEVFEVLR
jgi:hypothetical protein